MSEIEMEAVKNGMHKAGGANGLHFERTGEADVIPRLA
jgi:hypothetical protein